MNIDDTCVSPPKKFHQRLNKLCNKPTFPSQKDNKSKVSPYDNLPKSQNEKNCMTFQIKANIRPMHSSPADDKLKPLPNDDLPQTKNKEILDKENMIGFHAISISEVTIVLNFTTFFSGNSNIPMLHSGQDNKLEMLLFYGLPKTQKKEHVIEEQLALPSTDQLAKGTAQKKETEEEKLELSAEAEQKATSTPDTIKNLERFTGKISKKPELPSHSNDDPSKLPADALPPSQNEEGVIEEKQPSVSADSTAKYEEPLGMATWGAVWKEQEEVGRSTDTGIKTHSGPDEAEMQAPIGNRQPPVMHSSTQTDDLKDCLFNHPQKTQDKEIQASLSNLFDSFTQTESLYMCTTDLLRTKDEKSITQCSYCRFVCTKPQKCEKVNLEESKPPAEDETPESHHPQKESSSIEQTSELQDVRKPVIDTLGNSSLTVKNSGDQLPDDASVHESQLVEGPRHNFQIVKERVKRLCDEVGVKNATIAIANRLAKCTVIGENTSSLNSKIKEDEYLRHFNITVKERQGKQHSHLLSIDTVFRKTGLLVKCELFLKDSSKHDYYAFLPAHSFLDEKHFDIQENLNWFQEQEYEITFQYPSKELVMLTRVPKFLFCRDNESSFKTVMDIAAVNVDQSMAFDGRGEPFCKPMILKVDERALNYLIDNTVTVFLKSDDAGYILDMHNDDDCFKGLLWVDFECDIFKRGDCGTVIYVKDSENNKYMISTLRERHDEVPWYGTTVLSYNIEELRRHMIVESLKGLYDECIFMECTEELLHSLRCGLPMETS